MKCAEEVSEPASKSASGLLRVPLKAMNKYYTGSSQFPALILSGIDSPDVLNHCFSGSRRTVNPTAATGVFWRVHDDRYQREVQKPRVK